MIIRLSNKLGEKIHFPPKQEISLHENPFLDWSAHLFQVSRAQYIMITNTTTLYSVLMHGKGITDGNEFLKRAKRSLEEMLDENGYRHIFEEIIRPAAGTYHFCKALNRSVIGCMNNLVKQAKICLSDRELSPYETAFSLNELPFSYLDFRKPNEVFQKLVKESS